MKNNCSATILELPLTLKKCEPRSCSGQATLVAHAIPVEDLLEIRRPPPSEEDLPAQGELPDGSAARLEGVQLVLIHANGSAVVVVLVWMLHKAFL